MPPNERKVKSFKQALLLFAVLSFCIDTIEFCYSFIVLSMIRINPDLRCFKCVKSLLLLRKACSCICRPMLQAVSWMLLLIMIIIIIFTP